MKANRKFKQEDEAVSAVIGVILMVAITVAIAATVYVYVSGMLGTGQTSTPNIAFTKGSDRLTVSRADSVLKWEEFEVTFPTTITWVQLNTDTADEQNGATSPLDLTSTDNIDAGHYINVTGYGALSIRHVPTNSLIGTWTFTI